MSDSKATLTLIFVCLAVIAILFLIGFAVDYIDCLGKVADIGYPYRFKMIGGCQLEVQDNIWIPLDRYYFRENLNAN